MLNNKTEIMGFILEVLSAFLYCGLIYTAVLFAMW
jgi:hypothetical protein